MTKNDLIEALAKREHQQWSDWQRWVHACGRCRIRDARSSPLGEGDLILPAEHVAHWEDQMSTPYAELSAWEQDANRQQVACYWPLIVAFVADWLDTYCDGIAADAWVAEMENAVAEATAIAEARP